MTIRRYVVLGRSEALLLQQRIEATFIAWQREWCAGETAASDIVQHDIAECRTMAMGWQSCGSGDAAVGVGVPDVATGDFVSALTGSAAASGSESGIGVDLINAALTALGSRILNDAGVTNQAVNAGKKIPGDDAWESVQGFVAIRCRFAQAELYVVLFPQITDAYLRTVAATAQSSLDQKNTRRHLVGFQPARLEVNAGEAELSLPELATLSVGDVIALNRRLDEPASVKVGDADICAAYLGTQQQQKAVQLIRLHEGNEV